MAGEDHDDSINEHDSVDHDESLSLEDIGAAFARVAAESGDPDLDDPDEHHHPGEYHLDAPEIDAAGLHADGPNRAGASAVGHRPGDDDAGDIDRVPSPISVVEAALFVGHPENQALTAARIASLMRDVTPAEVVEWIDELNASYKEHDQAIRIVAEETGFRMTIAPQVESVRQSFSGKVRETRLNQAAIEVLALVAYQPGITAAKVNDQRGQDSQSILNQMVRRNLLFIERDTDGDLAAQAGKAADTKPATAKPAPAKPAPGATKRDRAKREAHYYPTERFLVLFGLESLEELPRVEESLREW
ncbi:MAG: SMC-Scp complex subunit ScpB [Planctomycetota bacterium]